MMEFFASKDYVVVCFFASAIFVFFEADYVQLMLTSPDQNIQLVCLPRQVLNNSLRVLIRPSALFYGSYWTLVID